MKRYSRNIVCILASIASFACYTALARPTANKTPARQQQPAVLKRVLKNGFTVLVRPVKTTQPVAVKLWVNAGSKDEGQGEKGIAHLIEHMLFKGTKEHLSEGDMWALGSKLAAHVNAATSYDSTVIDFGVPTAYWKETMPILADVFVNCTFKDELLNSELRTVLNEFAIHNDIIFLTADAGLRAIFQGHPYQYPLIGYRHDLYHVTGNDLKKFYRKHYIPNNASLIVVGNINPDEVFALAEKHFGHLKPNRSYKKQLPPVKPSLKRYTIERPFPGAHYQFSLIWQIPGLRTADQYTIDALTRLIEQRLDPTLNKQVARLTTKTLQADNFNLFEGNILCIFGTTQTQQKKEKLIKLIQKEIASIASTGCSPEQLATIQRLVKKDNVSLLENVREQARSIGDCFWSRNDPAYPFKDHSRDDKTLEKEIRSFATRYLVNGMMHSLLLIPLTDKTRALWQEACKKEQEEDEIILKNRKRTCNLEEAKYVKKLKLTDPKTKNYPSPSVMTLPNGLTILYHHAPNIPLVHCSLDFKVTHGHEEEPGMVNLLFGQLMRDGSTKKSPEEMKRTLDRHGISFTAIPSHFNVKCLSEELPTALALLSEKILTPRFSPDILQSQKEFLITITEQEKKEPQSVASSELRSAVFSKDHWPNTPIVSTDTIKKLTINQIKGRYHSYITPRDTILCIVGDLTDIDIPALCRSLFAQWRGPVVPDAPHNVLSKKQSQEKTHCLPAQEVVLLIGSQMVDTDNPAWHSLCIAEGLINDALFNIRQQTGAFYACGANIISLKPLDSPECSYVCCFVAPQRLKLVKDTFMQCITTIADTISEEDLVTQRRNVMQGYNGLYATNKTAAETFISLYRNKLPFDFYTQSMETLKKLSLADVKKHLKNSFHPDRLHTVAAGPCKDVEKKIEKNKGTS